MNRLHYAVSQINQITVAWESLSVPLWIPEIDVANSGKFCHHFIVFWWFTAGFFHE
jgi:hypothetical protein